MSDSANGSSTGQGQTTPHGTFFWMELNTPDVEAAKAFFGATIGWTFKKDVVEGADYWLAMANGVPVAGIIDLTVFAPPGAPAHWFCYLAVDAIQDRLERAKEAGVTIVRAPFEVAGVGTIAIVKDPTGAVMGWIEPARR